MQASILELFTCSGEACANLNGKAINRMYFDRFDIVSAHYWFCADYHGGQGCYLYAKLCRISEYFTPSALANGPGSKNAREIYDNLVAENGHI